MMQYTIEHYERPAEPVSLFWLQDIYVEVDEDDKEAISRLLALSRYGITVRPSTPEEEHHVWALEVELEYDEPDVARQWPEEEAEIILQIKDW